MIPKSRKLSFFFKDLPVNPCSTVLERYKALSDFDASNESIKSEAREACRRMLSIFTWKRVFGKGVGPYLTTLLSSIFRLDDKELLERALPAVFVDDSMYKFADPMIGRLEPDWLRSG